MNNEFFDALSLLEKEKGVPADYLLEKIKAAIVIAVKRDFGGLEAVNVEIDPETRKFKVSILKDVVDEVEDPVTQISVDEARKYNKKAQTGSPVEIKLDPKQFGRIAAQTAKHVIRQGIREGEREQILAQYESKLNEVVSAVVEKIDSKTGNATIDIDKNEAVLFKNEQLPGEELVEGQRIKVYVADVLNSDRRCSLKVSRTHRDMVKRLFEMEVPEIYDGTVEIKAISREAGSRTKIAVYSRDENVDAVGACIGPKRSRVSHIVEELNGEKIDIVRYSDDPAEFISQALSPAEVVSVELLDGETRSCRVRVPDHQLSLAIGNKGQNAKLAARLTGYKIDIRPESGFFGEDEAE